MGWTADAHLSSLEAMHNFNVPALYSNWLRTIHDDDRDGALPGSDLE